MKAGPDGVAAALRAGVNDLGGTLMNESISRAAGAGFGQEMPPERMEEMIRAAGRVPRQRTTTYGEPDPERVAASFGAAPLAEPLNPPVDTSGCAGRSGSSAPGSPSPEFPSRGAMPHTPTWDAPGSRMISDSPLESALGGQVIGSTARLRRATSGRSPVNTITYG